MKVAIVGAGIIGSSIAYQLSRQGVSVSVFDAGEPGKAASAKTFGWINASFAETDAYYALRLQSVRAWRALHDEINFGEAIRWFGALWWEDEGDDFTRQVNELQRRGYPFELVGPERFHALEPEVRNPPDQAILGMEEAAADGAQVSAILLKTAVGLGAQVVFKTPVEKIAELTAQFDQVVICAGANSGALLSETGVTLPMGNQPGILVKTTPLPPLVDHTIMTPDVHFRQLACGRILMGEIFSGGNIDGRSSQVFAADMLGRLKARLPAAQSAEVETIMTGLRPVPEDGLPAVGPATSKIYVATMHSGITLAPLIGELVCREILGETCQELEPFRIARFSVPKG